jgi:hypothetical protein
MWACIARDVSTPCQNCGGLARMASRGCHARSRLSAYDSRDEDANLNVITVIQRNERRLAMNTEILGYGNVLLIGVLIVLFAGILIGVAASGGRRQDVPMLVIQRQPDDSGSAGGWVVLAVAMVIVITALARAL